MKQAKVLIGLAAGSLAISLLLFGGRGDALDARSAATNSPNLTALPLGDGKASTSGPSQGGLFVCQQGNPNAPGAQVAGPWITGATYNLLAKVSVDGINPQPTATFKAKVKKAVLKLFGNGLPTNHGTGNFPIRQTDDAFQYDRNPGTVTAQAISERLTTKPRLASTPACVPGGMIGLATNGVAIFNAVDARGDDAVAHEIQDACSGHPQQQGQYHYHGLPACISYGNENAHSKLIGWVLDGFPIYGPIGNGGRYMRTSDLDECHGHKHKIKYQGKKQKLFHYHATSEFPYTVGCLRGGTIVP